MATETEQLLVQLEARIDQFEKNFKKANKTASDSWTKIEKRGRTAGTRMQADMGAAVASVNRVLAGLGVGFSLVAAQQLIDASTRINNALKVAGLSGDELRTVYEALFASAQKNAAPLEALVQLYGRASLVQKELAISTQELLQFTDHVAVALRVSGKSAEELSGALLQLSQALGSGTVHAEEFNSILENALPIAQAAAAGISEAGGSVAKLRALVVAGKVSSAAFFRGFEAGAVTLETKVAGAQLTVAQGFVRLENAAIDAAKRINDVSGASQGAASALDGLASIVEKLADAFGSLARTSSMSRVVKNYNDLGAAARNLWNDPSFQNLYEFLFDASHSQKKADAADAITARARAFDSLADSMRKANAQTKLAQSKSATPSRFYQDFSAFTPKPVTLKDFPVTATKKTGANQSPFDAELARIQNHVDLMGVEARTIDETTAARERAKAVVELEAAARKANAAAGLKDVSVTDAQRAKIEALADSYAKVRTQLDSLRTPLANFARESANVGDQLQNSAVSVLDDMSSSLADVLMGTKSAEDAFRAMTAEIIKDLIQIALRKAILGPIAGALGGIFGGGIFDFGGGRAEGGPMMPGKVYLTGERGPELVVPKAPATVVPNHVLRTIGGGSVSQANTFNINVEGGGGTPAQNQDLAQRIARQLKDAVPALVTKEITRQMRPGGIIRSGRQ